jgi:hypothetical protein
MLHTDSTPVLHATALQLFKLNLVLFTDALLHLMRASRLMAMARGSGLLVGVGGSGKQSLARLAAYINGATTFQITVTKVRYPCKTHAGRKAAPALVYHAFLCKFSSSVWCVLFTQLQLLAQIDV